MAALLTVDQALRHEATALGEALLARGWLCGCAESCTGGLAGAVCTAIPGASQWFAGGVVSYANAVKTGLLGVKGETLEAFGAVSEAVARQMVEGLCSVLHAQAGVSITGVAGPGGGSVDKPVGTVWLAFCVQGTVTAQMLSLGGSREEIRSAAVFAALAGLRQRLK